MKPLSERDENHTVQTAVLFENNSLVGMKPLSERDENFPSLDFKTGF